MIGGSAIGGMKETQEMIDFAAKHNIIADVEVIPMDYVNTALERLAKGDVKYRFVIDVANTLNSPFWVDISWSLLDLKLVIILMNK